MCRCIYCNSTDLTISDIIPYALTGAKITKRFVCRQHNAFTNDNFEKYVIQKFDYFRNSIGLTTRDGKPIKYKADVIIDGMVITNAELSDRQSFYGNDKRLFPVEHQGNKVLLGSISRLEKIKGAEPKPLDITDVTTEYSFSLADLLISDNMLRTVGKIAYEWHCFANNICEYDDSRYVDIVSYIIGSSEGKNIVDCVVDGNLFSVMDMLSDYGTNSIYEYVDIDGYCYVIFYFWNIALYKIKIYYTGTPNMEKVSNITLYRYRIDGIKDMTTFAKYGSSHVISETPEKALIRLQKFYLDKLTTLLKTKVLSIYSVKQMVSSLHEDLIKYCASQLDFANLLDYEDSDRITAIRLVICFSENKNRYDGTDSFNSNLKKFLNTDEIFTVTVDENLSYIKKLVELNNEGTLIPTLIDGINTFEIIWKSEQSKQL